MEHISRVTVSMPEETVESMRTIADRKHISFSAVMREACEHICRPIISTLIRMRSSG